VTASELLFAPLGGVGEIGMNLSIYGLGSERRRSWLAVDCGVAFGGDDLPGVDLVMPDIRFLADERRDLVGIVLTHAHEDHFGALMDLWPHLRAPVYATPFTAALLQAKLRSEPGAPDIPLTVVGLGSRWALGPFDIELVSVAHSIPESNALVIRTELGTVLHTGDWKLDPTPVIGPPTDEAKLRALGGEGVLAVVGDSTNAVREGRSPSEADVARTLMHLIGKAQGRVAVTTFASNVARIRSAALGAFAAGREVLVIGRAMERIVQIARETGYLDGIGEFRSPEVYAQLPPAKVLALCTGSQGEPRAALARIAEEAHPEVSLGKGDCVIFSSRTIPGNEKAVGRVVNGLIRQGVQVITDRTELVHVSGHPRRAELADLYGWVKPRILVPVHGEPLHLHEHAALGRELGIPEVLTCENGDLVRLAPGRARVVDEVPAARLYKDGRLIVEAEGRTLPDRRRLAFAGIVTVALALTERGDIAADPVLELTGIPDRNAEGEPLEDIAQQAAISTVEQLPRARRRDPDTVAEAVRGAVRSALAAHWGKKPMCRVHVLTLE
jgi:ribonuclease J